MAMKDDPAPAPRPRATACGVDNRCNFEGGQDGETMMAPAPMATAPAPPTDTGRDDDTSASTSNHTNKHQDPQNAKNGRSTPQP